MIIHRTARRKVPSRHEKYLGLAFFLSSFSKDPHTQMGSVIVKDNEILGMGYNGPPACIFDDDTRMNWGRESEIGSSLVKYDTMIHSEINSIRFHRGNIVGSTLYVTGLPCSECMKTISAYTIGTVIYYYYKSNDKESSFVKNTLMFEKTKHIAQLANIPLIKFEGSLNWIKDKTKEWNDLGLFK